MPETYAEANGDVRRRLTARNLRLALSDLTSGLKRWPLWSTLGSQDIRQRYRRSRLGPFWLTLSLGVTVAALGFVYGSLFKQPLEDYLPYLAAGFVVWGLIAGLINDGTRSFTECEGLIRQLSAPLSIYVFRTVWTALLVFLHNIVVYFVVALLFTKSPGWAILLIIPALFLTLVNGIWFCLLLGLISARFRDVPQIVASIVQVMFFVTPILWTADMLPDRALLLEANPFYHAVELLRAPLLGETADLLSWVISIVLAIAGWLATLSLYSGYRWRIAYWV